MNHKTQSINELTSKIKEQGFRVFIAKSGTYGFFTDTEGSKVVCFQVDFLSPSFSGNYKTDNPKSTGTGWRISDSDTEDYGTIFNAYPPHWAVGDSKWKFTTLDQHLDSYQKSSHYSEA
jgi:hypothetical protein